MASSTSKKVQIRRFDRDELFGFVNPVTFLADAGVELLTPAGTVLIVEYLDVKLVDFVREFAPSTPYVEKTSFLTRPKLEGLWVRLRFRDGDFLEGVLPNNLLQIARQGFTITPPDFVGNRQRVFVPRSSVTDVVVLGVIGSPLKKEAIAKKRARSIDGSQLPMFE